MARKQEAATVQADKIDDGAADSALTMERVLRRENELLDRIIDEQQNLREEVKKRQWDKLMETISIVSMLADDFNSTDNERDVLEASVTDAEQSALLPLRSDVRSKLMRSKAASRALGEYIAITQAFVRSVIDDAAETENPNVYARNGRFSSSRPRSVLVNTVM